MRYSKLQNRIEEFRLSLWFSQERLSKEVGVSRVSIHKIESGKSVPSLTLANKIANVLGVCVYCVFDLTETGSYICKHCENGNR